MVNRVVIDPLWCAKGLAVVRAAGEHHVGPVAGAGRKHTGDHVDVIVSRTAGTVHCYERLAAESYSIYAALNQVATHVDLRSLVEGRCLTSILCVARANAPKRAPASGEKKIAVRVDIHRSGIGRVWNINRTHPGCPAIRGTIKFPKVTSKEAGPKLIYESVAHASDIRINGEPFFVTSMPRFIWRLLHKGLAAVCGAPQIIAKK
jgi:hypothetical protein